MATADVTHQAEAPQARRTIHARLVGAHFETEQSLRECAAAQLAALREQLAVALLELEAALQILDRLG